MLRWDWNNDKVGTWTEKHGDKEFTYNLYSGNAVLIMIAEWEENGTEKYTVSNFFCDKEHMKNCFGLNKGCDNIFEDNLKEITIKQDYRYTKDIIQCIAKAKFTNNIVITLTNEPW